jgi:hypothetical protein
MADNTPQVVVVDEPYADGELDSKFGGLQKAEPVRSRSLNQPGADEALDTKLSYEKTPLPDGDEELTDEKWLYSHLNRIAQRDLKAKIAADRWQGDAVLAVEILGTEGKITRSQIHYMRGRRDLRVVDAMLGRGFLAGWLPEFRLYGLDD